MSAAHGDTPAPPPHSTCPPAGRHKTLALLTKQQQEQQQQRAGHRDVGGHHDLAATLSSYLQHDATHKPLGTLHTHTHAQERRGGMPRDRLDEVQRGPSPEDSHGGGGTPGR